VKEVPELKIPSTKFQGTKGVTLKSLLLRGDRDIFIPGLKEMKNTTEALRTLRFTRKIIS
jgi:hypothetical protein